MCEFNDLKDEKKKNKKRQNENASNNTHFRLKINTFPQTVLKRFNFNAIDTLRRTNILVFRKRLENFGETIFVALFGRAKQILSAQYAAAQLQFEDVLTQVEKKKGLPHSAMLTEYTILSKRERKDCKLNSNSVSPHSDALAMTTRL